MPGYLGCLDGSRGIGYGGVLAPTSPAVAPTLPFPTLPYPGGSLRYDCSYFAVLFSRNTFNKGRSGESEKTRVGESAMVLK